MRFEETHVGGIEPGPVTLRYPGGNKGLCQRYINPGRQLLGELKQRMQMDGVGYAKTDLTLPDGVKLHAQSNMIGLADIDEIWIDASASASSGSSYTCRGYIVKIFDEFSYGYTKIKITLPNGDFLDNNRPRWYSHHSDVTFAGYPDNGAKYLVTDAGNIEWQSVLSVRYMYTDGGEVLNDEYTGLTLYAPLPGIVTYPLPPVKRVDNRALIIDGGLVFDGDKFVIYDLYSPASDEGKTYGVASAMMLPAGNSIRFSYSDAIKARSNTTSSGGAEVLSGAGDFGVPVDVDTGTHVVTAWSLNYAMQISPIDVYLQMENDDTGETELVYYQYTTEPSVGTFPTVSFEINVGQTVNSLVGAKSIISIM